MRMECRRPAGMNTALPGGINHVDDPAVTVIAPEVAYRSWLQGWLCAGPSKPLLNTAVYVRATRKGSCAAVIRGGWRAGDTVCQCSARRLRPVRVFSLHGEKCVVLFDSRRRRRPRAAILRRGIPVELRTVGASR